MLYKDLSRNEKEKQSLILYMKIASLMSPCNKGEPMSFWIKTFEEEHSDAVNNYDKYSYRSMFDILYKDYGLICRYGEKKKYTYDIVLKDFDEIIKMLP